MATHATSLRLRPDLVTSVASRRPTAPTKDITLPMGTACDVFPLPRLIETRVLGLGSDLKASLCLCRQREAILSPSFGSLTDPSCYRAFLAWTAALRERPDAAPQLLARDMHPLYLTTGYAQSTGLPTMAVQHHHAHVVSVMAEWALDKPVVGICCDGVGYGTDGAAWGGELLVCDWATFDRRGQIEYMPLVGGDAAAIETWRPAAALLRQAFGDAWRGRLPSAFDAVTDERINVFERLVARDLNTPPSSSLGRVFDGVAFLLGLCRRNEHGGQAAIAVEQVAGRTPAEPYPYETRMVNGRVQMSPAPAIRAIVADIGAGADVHTMAARFHETIARMLVASTELVCDQVGLSRVVVAGGCFLNRRLRTRVIELLERRHLQVFAPRRVPIGDDGLALGQAVAAAAMHERAAQCV